MMTMHRIADDDTSSDQMSPCRRSRGATAHVPPRQAGDDDGSDDEQGEGEDEEGAEESGSDDSVSP